MFYLVVMRRYWYYLKCYILLWCIVLRQSYFMFPLFKKIPLPSLLHYRVASFSKKSRYFPLNLIWNVISCCYPSFLKPGALVACDCHFGTWNRVGNVLLFNRCSENGNLTWNVITYYDASFLDNLIWNTICYCDLIVMHHYFRIVLIIVSWKIWPYLYYVTYIISYIILPHCFYIVSKYHEKILITLVI